MAAVDRRWVVWFSNPRKTGWNFWGTRKTKEAAEEVARDIEERDGYQTFIQGPVDFPKIEGTGSKPKPK